MSGIILDCSTTLSLVFEDEIDDYSDRVIDEIWLSGATVPLIWPLEVANTLYINVKRGRVTESDVHRFFALLAALPIEIAQAGNERAVPIALELFALAQRHKLTAYDASYLRLAMTSGLPLASRDKELNEAAVAAGVKLFT